MAEFIVGLMLGVVLGIGFAFLLFYAATEGM